MRQLEAQTTRITEACLTAVDQALRGFERAEARLTTLEQELHREMGTLAREVREALAELRQKAPGARCPATLVARQRRPDPQRAQVGRRRRRHWRARARSGRRCRGGRASAPRGPHHRDRAGARHAGPRRSDAARTDRARSTPAAGSTPSCPPIRSRCTRPGRPGAGRRCSWACSWSAWARSRCTSNRRCDPASRPPRPVPKPPNAARARHGSAPRNSSRPCARHLTSSSRPHSRRHARRNRWPRCSPRRICTASISRPMMLASPRRSSGADRRGSRFRRRGYPRHPPGRGISSGC